MSTKTYRRSIVISVPTERMEMFYTALERLKARFPLFSQSAIIVYLVLDPMGQRLVSAYTGQHGASALVPPAPIERDSIEYKSSLGVSIPEALRRPFFEALAQLEQHSTHRGKSPIILDIVIQADAEHSNEDFATPDEPPSTGWVRPTNTLPQEMQQAGDDDANGEAVDLERFPDIFQEYYYRGQTGHLAGHVDAMVAHLDQHSVQSPHDLHQRALIYQLLGVVLLDSGMFEAALPLLKHALSDAEALAQTQRAEALNLKAAIYYRYASMYLQQYRESAAEVGKASAALAAHHQLQVAHDFFQDEGCRPCVRAVINVQYATVLAMPEVKPNPDFDAIHALLQEAEKIATVQEDAGESGYDPVGFYYHRAGLYHAWAKIILELSYSHGANVPAAFSLSEGERYIRQAIASPPPGLSRWLYDFHVTHLLLTIQQNERRQIDDAAIIAYLVCHTPDIRSQRLLLDLQQASQRMQQFAESLRQLSEELQAVVKK